MFEVLSKTINELSSEKIAADFITTLPESLSDQDRKEIAPKIENILAQKICALKIAKLEVENEVEEKFEKAVQTTKDLEKVPIFGPIGLFIRGMQRPIWGFALLYIDLKILSGAWPLIQTLPQDAVTSTSAESTFWLINLLVLGFLFGERAVKNVMPMINRRTGKIV
ncbi:MAG: hypothetical protein D3924_11980 [Candidatus Electrothrix sp. AR4]|nr:hypothetical protein [Candidatus Electrothrix sp. AR4]